MTKREHLEQMTLHRHDPKVRPIDQSKKSNRRCCNCGHYPGPCNYTTVACLHPDNEQRAVNYWNCCKHFVWREDREYLEEDTKNADT